MLGNSRGSLEMTSISGYTMRNRTSYLFSYCIYLLKEGEVSSQGIIDKWKKSSQLSIPALLIFPSEFRAAKIRIGIKCAVELTRSHCPLTCFTALIGNYL